MPRDGYVYYKVSERKGEEGAEEGRRERRRFTFIFNHFLYNICLGNGREGEGGGCRGVEGARYLIVIIVRDSKEITGIFVVLRSGRLVWLHPAPCSCFRGESELKGEDRRFGLRLKGKIAGGLPGWGAARFRASFSRG